ncbi:MAG: IS3 family transposase [Candidatus Kapaibacterium sp.]
MARQRRTFSAEFKAKVALEAARGERTLGELASLYSIHPNQIAQWRTVLTDRASDLFSATAITAEAKQQELINTLYQQIGQLSVELGWLKKRGRLIPSATRRLMLESVADAPLSLRQQCQLLGVARSSYYYRSTASPAEISAEQAQLMRLIDEQYLAHPFFGSRKMTYCLKQQGYAVNRKRVQRLMRMMGIEAIAPKPRTSQPHPQHRVYPYLLRDVSIEQANHVWSTDITYVPLGRSFAYLTAVIDWYSRYVISWELSHNMEVGFCLAALDRALQQAVPRIFNTDQGSQYTSAVFTGRLEQAGIAISMDGRGRCHDNIFIERLWRTVKYEEIYLHEYLSMQKLEEGLAAYFQFYNSERPHQSLGYRTPEAVYRAALTH